MRDKVRLNDLLKDDDVRSRDMKDDESNIDLGDCMIVDSPPIKLKTSNLSFEVKLYRSHWSFHSLSIQHTPTN
jgi:lysyl-tRNA synthetase class II